MEKEKGTCQRPEDKEITKEIEKEKEEEKKKKEKEK